MAGHSLTYAPKAFVGYPAPAFEAMAYGEDGRFKKLTLEAYRGKYLVLFFYPLDFTFVCPTEIVQFSDLAPEFRANDCEVIGASIDSLFSHREYSLKSREDGGLGQLNIPLLADITKQVSKDYGAYIDHGNDAGVALRATYIINRTGVIRHISANDLPVGRSVQEVLRLVKAFQYTDVYGEVCPESWTPGEATMVTEHGNEKTEQYWKTKHAQH
jgi:alkyl hydroperoxide reductase subunit AhpC